MGKCIRKHWFSFICVGMLGILMAGFEVLLSLVLKDAIDLVLDGKVGEAVKVCVAFSLSIVTLSLAKEFSQAALNQQLMMEIRNAIAKGILRKNYVEYEEHSKSDYLSLVTNDVKRLEEEYLNLFFTIEVLAFQLCFGIAVMTYYSWVFTATMMGMTIFMFVVPAFFSKRLGASTEKLSQGQERMTHGISEIVSGFEVIKSYGQERMRQNKFENINLLLKRCALKNIFLKKSNDTASQFLSLGMQFVVCLIAAYFIYRNKMSYGSMIGVIQVSNSIATPVFGLFSAIPAIRALKPIEEKIEEYAEKREDAPFTSDAGMNEDWKEIRMERVSFQYPDTDTFALKDVSMSIRKGKKYVIVGKSGGGKSTLIKLLCGIYEPGSGRITVDGKENVDRTKSIALVHQNIFLFDESIQENITFGDENPDALNKAIRDAHLEAVIRERGEDFDIGENGNLLSGGQRQRVALARGFFSNRKIVVLDEGLSALDKATADAIENQLLERDDITLIAISHRTSSRNLDRYDQVIKFEEGRKLGVDMQSPEC